MTRAQNALVTGASSGLGRELARQLVIEREMIVLATARRLDRLEALSAELPPGRLQILAGDLTDAGFREELWGCAEAMAGGVDLLVNNAGLGNYADFTIQVPEAIRRIIELNIVALIDLSQKAARHMKARGEGQILEISSVLGFFGIRDSAVYAASKHAVNGLVKSLRYELHGTGVHVWAACPARTASEFRQVALAERGAEVGRLPVGEPTEKIVRAILRGLDQRSPFVLPSWRAWLVANLAHWLPGPFNWMCCRWAPGSYKKVLCDPIQNVQPSEPVESAPPPPTSVA
jgi:short-subunit dehydrogenase